MKVKDYLSINTELSHNLNADNLNNYNLNIVIDDNVYEDYVITNFLLQSMPWIQLLKDYDSSFNYYKDIKTFSYYEDLYPNLNGDLRLLFHDEYFLIEDIKYDVIKNNIIEMKIII